MTTRLSWYPCDNVPFMCRFCVYIFCNVLRIRYSDLTINPFMVLIKVICTMFLMGKIFYFEHSLPSATLCILPWNGSFVIGIIGNGIGQITRMLHYKKNIKNTFTRNTHTHKLVNTGKRGPPIVPLLFNTLTFSQHLSYVLYTFGKRGPFSNWGPYCSFCYKSPVWMHKQTHTHTHTTKTLNVLPVINLISQCSMGSGSFWIDWSYRVATRWTVNYANPYHVCLSW